MFDLTKDLNKSSQIEAQTGDIAVFLCPQDPSPGSRGPRDSPPFGRSNYFANHGSSALFTNSDPATAGPFDYSPTTTEVGVALEGVADGTSNTVLYCEVKRGNPQDPAPLPTDVTWLALAGEWENDRSPFPACDQYQDRSVFKYTGCMFYRGFFVTSLYTHTAPPNYRGRDCVYIDVDQKTTLDRGHQAARSHHSGGVNAAFADGSVRVVRDSVAMPVWQALGTRSAGDIVDHNAF